LKSFNISRTKVLVSKSKIQSSSKASAKVLLFFEIYKKIAR